MKMNKKILLIILVICLSSNIYPVVGDPNYEVNIKFDVRVLSFNPKTKECEYNLEINIGKCPFEADIISVELYDFSSSIIVNCSEQIPSTFRGEIVRKTNKLRGIGDMYPYDYYILDISLENPFFCIYEEGSMKKSVIIEEEVVPLFNFEYAISNSSTAQTATIKDASIYDEWDLSTKITKNHHNKNEFNVFLIRKNTAILYSQFILPLVLVESLMILSILISLGTSNPIFSIYLSLISFSPLTMVALNSFLPHRVALAIPEFLIIIIFCSSITLIIRYLILDAFNKDKKVPSSIAHLSKEEFQLSIPIFIFDIALLILGSIGYSKLIQLYYKPIIHNIIQETAVNVLSQIPSLFAFAILVKSSICFAYYLQYYFNTEKIVSDITKFVESIR